MHWDIVVVGAGAAGLIAAARAAEMGKRTLLLEKNKRPGVKILMSGGTRCNLTHNTDRRGIIDAFGKPGRFLHSALAALGPKELVSLVEAEGVATKVEENGKIFPVSNQASDVLDAFLARLRRSGATLALDDRLTSLERTESGFQLYTAHSMLSAASVIVTTGGQSYPGCGTTGDGYTWARALGHTIVPTRPALTPITTRAAWVGELRGITLPDVELRVLEPVDGSKPRELDRRRGSFLFAHFGLSGPAPLDISRAISGHPAASSLQLQCDFLPHLNEEQLAADLQRECSAHGKKELTTILSLWVPHRLGDSLVKQLGIPANQRGAELNKGTRNQLVQALKRQMIPISGTLGYEKAEVTAGGVSLDEVDSRTLASKRVPGLYFAGEVLDLDGPIGGFNFQAAFSTGYLAGQSA